MICRRPLVQSWANMAVTRAYTMPWSPLLARLADDSSDADARRRDAKLSDADASPQIANAADADADATTVVERRRRRRRWRWRRRGGRAIERRDGRARVRDPACEWPANVVAILCYDHTGVIMTRYGRTVVWMIAMIKTRNRVIPLLAPLRKHYKNTMILWRNDFLMIILIIIMESFKIKDEMLINYAMIEVDFPKRRQIKS